MKKLFAFLFCAATLAGIAGCSNDDNDGPDLRDDAAALVGTWKTTTHQWTEYANGKKIDSGTDKDDWFTLELTADGEYHWREEGDMVSSSDDGYYTYDKEIHLFRLNHSVDFALKEATVIRLTDTVLELSWAEEGEDEGIIWKDENVLSFKRIN